MTDRPCVFAFTVPRPDAEAVIVFKDVSWPMPNEARAYAVAKRVGAFGFWRIKAPKKPAP